MPAPEPYRSLASALNSDGQAQPQLLVDRTRLDHNLALLKARSLPQSIRLVAKSLPSIPLLEHAMTALGTRRLMSFHRPFLQLDCHWEDPRLSSLDTVYLDLKSFADADEASKHHPGK